MAVHDVSQADHNIRPQFLGGRGIVLGRKSLETHGCVYGDGSVGVGGGGYDRYYAARAENKQRFVLEASKAAKWRLVRLAWCVEDGRRLLGCFLYDF